MNSTPLQAFRSQSSPEIISIPTRYDLKCNQHVVLWTDIQQSFGSVKRIMRSGATVVFLADENLQYLIPLRIAHQPDMVLEVVASDDNQGDPSSSNHRSRAVVDLPVVAGSSSEEKSVARDVASLSIRGTDDDNQALVVSPHNLSLGMTLRQLPPSIANPFQLGTENDMDQQEEPHMFQLQMDELVRRMQQADQKMEEVLERTQQTDQRREHTQQQLQEQNVQILQTLQDMSRQHTEEAERITQQLNLQRQQWEEAL
ncbi:MAG: hypothetical protein J3Q66DRAFT_392552 [Benniella sp.]|nr:MAG: hypothetical protein J3Q66DRAFT_392552 [Benniella sp.]